MGVSNNTWSVLFRSYSFGTSDTFLCCPWCTPIVSRKNFWVLAKCGFGCSNLLFYPRLLSVISTSSAFSFVCVRVKYWFVSNPLIWAHNSTFFWCRWKFCFQSLQGDHFPSFCNRAAPKASLLVYVVTINGWEKFGQTRIGEVAILYFTLCNALWHSSVQMNLFLSSLVIGDASFAIPLMRFC